jgi:hypothetical protein
MLGELALGDVGNETDMGVGCVEWVGAIENAEVAVVPCTAKQRGEMSLGALDGLEDGGELFSHSEQAAIGGWLLIAQSVDQPGGP